MDEQVIDLGIKFMRGYEPAPTPEPVPGGGTDVAGSLAQTGDLNIAWIVGLVMLAFAIAGVVAYVFVNKKQFASIVAGVFKNNKQLVGIFHEVTNSFKSLKFSSFSLWTKIISAVIAILAIVCIICGCFSMNAHAAEGSITISPNKISAVVSEEGQITSWDPTNIILTNTSTTDKFDFKSIKVALTDEAKSVEALSSANVKITGFGGITVFDEKASDSKVTCTGLSLDESGSTTLEFEIIGTFDIAQLESLYDKQLFKISLNAEKSLPMYDNLYEYSLSELQQVSAYLAVNYEENKDYGDGDIRTKFRNFRDNGILTGTDAGKDNGSPIKNASGFKTFAKNHWAIDSAGRIATEQNFANDSLDTIQVRIIGIREDKDADGKDIGLTFMTTHALSATSTYEDNTTDFAKYGWAGPTEGGSCTLRTKLNDGSLFPQSLRDIVKTAAKGYQFSDSLGYSTAYDKFWAPSLKELYGNDDPSHQTEWWPSSNEGSQYNVFVNKGIEYNVYTPFANIDKFQDGKEDPRSLFVWSRSLYEGAARGACGVSGLCGGIPCGNSDVNYGHGVVSCFCI